MPMTGVDSVRLRGLYYITKFCLLKFLLLERAVRAGMTGVGGVLGGSKTVCCC